jgi:hypothetical protein
MKRTMLSILSASYLFLTSINAVTVIDWHGNVHQSEEKKRPKQHFTQKEYYDSQGRPQGYSRNNFLGETEHFDNGGRTEGFSKKNFFGEVEHYDNQGRYLGKSKDR